ncbi:MAG: SDR family NAD(P)-dependent oxidoreductase [Bacilli bacterium]|nr:SDR family NAD(P)-dependent oxidoreductase [Bacilli bacterium]MBN2877704.1 SDR family NAD(P)-dependent oxidoreductase [Bacilli bacterium]
MTKQPITILTGATSGIGRKTVRHLAQLGHHLVLGNRNKAKAKQVKEELLQEFPQAQIDLFQIDLSSFVSILHFVDEIQKSYDHIDYLINNAGILSRKNLVTEEGFEMAMGVNHLGTYLLTESMIKAYQEKPIGMIIMLSSIGIYLGGVKVKEDLFSRHRNTFQNYFDSKLANMIYTKELSLRLQSSGTIVLAADPGIVYSHIWKWQSKLGQRMDKLQRKVMKSPEQGAKAILRLVEGDYDLSLGNIMFTTTKSRKLPKKIRKLEVRTRYLEYTQSIVTETLRSKGLV